jgi:hypothetical protein
VEPLAWYKIAAPVAFVVGLVVLCAVKNLPRFRAMLLGIGLLSGYAVLQDQVSARLCPEYFTHFHNPIPGLTDPTLTGVAWGFLGAWWGGALFGYFAGIAATAGKRPPLTVRQLVVPMLVTVLGIAAVTALVGGAVAYYAEQFGVQIDPYMAGPVPEERQRALLAVCCYHLASYVSAIVGSVACCVWVGRVRSSAFRVAGSESAGPSPLP